MSNIHNKFAYLRLFSICVITITSCNILFDPFYFSLRIHSDFCWDAVIRFNTKRSAVEIFYYEHIGFRFLLQSIWLILDSVKTFVLYPSYNAFFHVNATCLYAKTLYANPSCYINVVYGCERRLTQKTLFWCLTTKSFMRFSMKTSKSTFVIRYICGLVNTIYVLLCVEFHF